MKIVARFRDTAIDITDMHPGAFNVIMSALAATGATEGQKELYAELELEWQRGMLKIDGVAEGNF